jgi:aldose 1-epimerase
MKSSFRTVAFCAAAFGALVFANGASAADATRSPFGRLADGRSVEAVTLSNGRGVSVRIITYGATLQAVIMPDREGRKADVTLGYATLAEYVANPQYFGSSVGRFANRIAGGRYVLDGRTHQAPVNDGANSLHGGPAGFDKAVWEIASVRSGPTASVTLRHVSPDGDQGYPGAVTVLATYSLGENNHLGIEYRATTDKPTIINLTNHVYWNLAGEGAEAGALNALVRMPADTYLPTDSGLIPTGEFKPVAGTPFDFRKPQRIGARVREASDPQIVIGRGYDHSWVFGRRVTPDEHLMAEVRDPVSGRGFELWSNQPAVQFYSGNFLDGTSFGKSRRLYRQGDGFALEPQIFPDTPNRPEFGSARLAPGETYVNRMTYRLTTAGAPKPKTAKRR